MLKKSLLEIYSLAVCLFSIAYLVIWAGSTIWSTVEYAMPEVALGSYDYEPHQSDDAFRRFLVKDHKDEEGYVAPSGVELTQARQSSWSAVLQSQRRSALREILQGVIYLLLGLVVFAFHWRMAGKARRADG